MKPHVRSLALTVMVAAIPIACGETPSGLCETGSDDLACDETVVSEPEIWTLELEQLEDGITSFYPRRGTVTLRLRLNHTTQLDPACQGHESGEEVTTFLADVEAFASRLQDPAAGTADGSWNCHGLAATVRLDDGTRYELVSEHPGSPPEWSWGRSYAVRWTAGARRGEFRLRRAEPGAFDHIRESHVDVLVQNRTGGQAWVQLHHPDSIFDPLRIDYRIPYPAEVPVSGTLNISWPAHGARRERREAGVPPSVALEGRGAFVWGPGGDDDWRVVCFLAPDHGNQVQLIVHEDGPECGEGWLDSGLFVAPAHSPLFIRAGTQTVQDTVTIVITAPESAPGAVTELSVGNTDPAVTGRVSDELLTVTVAPEATRGEHGLWVIGRLIQAGSVIYTDSAFLGVYVYDLDVSTAADTLQIAPGGSDTTSVLIDGTGYFSPVRFSATDLPAGVLDAPPSFSPSQTDRFLGVASVVTLDVAASAPPGTYDLTLCTTIVLDPLARCHPTPLVLAVVETEAGACGDGFDLRLDFNPIEVAAGGSDAVAVFIDRAAGFAEPVELQLFSVPGGPSWPEVLEAWAFGPNPVEGETGVTTLSFTMREDVSVGASYDFEIVGASPLLEFAPPEEWCRIPITFEVVQ